MSHKEVLLIDINQRIVEILCLNLKTHLGYEVHVENMGVKACEWLESNTPDIIITREIIGRETTLERLLENFKDNNRSFPIIAMLSKKRMANIKEDKDRDILYFEHGKDIKKLILTCADKIGKDQETINHDELEDYYPIPLYHFFSLQRSVCDVYIKIGKNENASFIKRIHKGDNLDSEDVDKYLSKGVEDLYIATMHRKIFVSSITRQILDTFNSKLADEIQTMKARQLSQETIAKNIQEIGVTPEIVEISRQSIKTLHASMKKTPKLKQMLKKLFSDKWSYSYQLTELTTFVGQRMMEDIDWAKKAQVDTLNFIAFFKDISLAQDSLTKIATEFDLAEADLNADDEELVMNHAQLSSELVVKYPKAPMGAEQIIRQHHGAVNGLGFPEFVSPQLSPLSLVFMLAEATARYILKVDRSHFDPKEMMKAMRRKFDSPRFKDYLDIMEKKFTK
jgi:hypothetical protein